jgi:membrane-associated phospholipid phosphatase
VVAGVAAPLVRRHVTGGKLGWRAAAVSAATWQAPLALARVAPPTRLRNAAVYALQMWAYVAHYDMPDDDPELMMRRLRVRYPIAADRFVGLGEIPTRRLQRKLGRQGRVLRHDVALSWLHWSWFIVPHGSVAYVLVRRPERFARAAGMMAATFDAGVAGYWLVPTAPPWWAGENGYEKPVRRIMVETGTEFWGTLWQRLYDSLGRNPFAAMPSLHFGTSVMAAHVLGEVGRLEAALGWTYALALGFALVYLGEHYVIDLVAGFALAETVRLAAPHVAPLARRIADAVEGSD